MINEITIRQIKPEEAAEFARLSAALFHETFAPFNDPLDMQLYLAESFDVEKVLRELNDPNAYCFYALKNSIAIGCMKLIIHEDASFTGKKSVELSRLYVSKAFHNQKIGAALMAFAIDFSLKQNAEKLWLGVWEHNQKAIDFYRKWHFAKTGEVDFWLGNDLQHDWLMEKILEEN